MQVMETIQLLGGDGDGIEGWLGKRSGEASEDSAGLRPFPRLLRFVRFCASGVCVLKAKKLPVGLEGIIFSDSTSSIFLITLPFQARVCSAELELPA